MNNYVLAVDIGTTSVKGLAVLADGQVLSSFQIAYPTHYPRSGYAEQDPEEIFQSLCSVIKKIALEVKTHELIALSFSSALHSVVAVDEKGTALTPLIIWADTRSHEEAASLKNTDSGKFLYFQTGTPVHPMSPLCKLLWMKKEWSEIFSTASKFISIKEYVMFRLTGAYVVDYSIASGTGIFDGHALRWSQEALDLLGISEDKLSTPVSPLHVSKMTDRYQADLTNARQVAVIAGAADGCLANLGSGAMNPGDVSITIGTSGAVRMTASVFSKDEKARIFNYRLDEKTFIIGGATNNGAMLLSWFTENFDGAKPDSPAFIKEVFSVSSSEGLIFLPYILGERSPMYDPDARGVFFGVSVNHTRAHFKHALLEGICFELKSILDALEEQVGPARNIIGSGGFINSKEWVQLLCNVLGKPISIDSQNDASSMGAALQGFQALNIKTNFRFNGKTLFMYKPDMERHTEHQRYFELFMSLYERLKNEFPKLKNL